MKDIFRNSSFVKLFAAGITSQLGNTIGTMALAFYLLDRFADQPFYATLAELMYSLPTLAVFFLVGVLADRMDRKKICAYSDWIRAGLTVVLLGAISAGWMPLVFGVLFVRSAVGKFFNPAQSSLVQSILPAEHYTSAAGLNQMVFSMFMLLGTGMGAMAYHYIGIYGAVMIDSAGFLISGALIMSTKLTAEVRLPNGKTTWSKIGLPLIIQDFREGIGYIFGNKLLLALIGGFFIFGFINGSFAVLPMFMMKFKLATDNYQWYTSLVTIFFGLGLLPGSLAGSYLVKKWGFIRVMVGGLLVNVGTVVGMAYTSEIWLFLAMAAIVGLSMGPVNVAIGGWMPTIIHINIRGRVNAWIDPIMMLSQSMALGLIALLFPKFIPLEAAFVGVGVCMLVVSVFYAVKLPGLKARYEAEKQAEDDSVAGDEKTSSALVGALEQTVSS